MLFFQAIGPVKGAKAIEMLYRRSGAPNTIAAAVCLHPSAAVSANFESPSKTNLHLSRDLKSVCHANFRSPANELTDAGGQWRWNWKLTWPARVRSSDFVSRLSHAEQVCRAGVRCFEHRQNCGASRREKVFGLPLDTVSREAQA